MILAITLGVIIKQYIIYSVLSKYQNKYKLICIVSNHNNNLIFFNKWPQYI